MASFGFKKKKKGRKLALNPAFGDDEDEDTSVSAKEAAMKEVSLRIEAQGRKAQAKAAAEYNAILEQDPTAFQFDEVYEGIQKKRAVAMGEKESGKESKYIERLLENTKQREFEFERATEKMYRKEQERDEKEFGKADEVFVTGAYKKRLEERRKWEIAEAKKAELEAKNDVRKRGTLSGFYTGMLQTLSKTTDDKPEVKQDVLTKEEATAPAAREHVVPETPTVQVVQNKDAAPIEMKVYKPGDMKRKREEEGEKKTAPKSKVPLTKIEEARRRAMERMQKKGNS